jgi:hypothetical protein
MTPIPGLHASAPHPLPFDTSIVVRAFLLERGDGNLLVYGARPWRRTDGRSWNGEASGAST